MKAALIALGVIVAGFIVVKVLGSTMAPPEFPKTDLGITGPLAMDAVSKALDTVQIWREPRSTHGREDREKLLVGDLREGEVFRVTNHFRSKDTLWVAVVVEESGTTGWVASPPVDPFKASRIR